MKEFPIPVVPFGPGSHPEADEVNFLPMPHEMDTFSMPVYSLEADPKILAEVCALLEKLRGEMLNTPCDGSEHPRLDLMGLSPKVVDLLNQSLGSGEVSIMVREPVPCHIQETVFAGVWRVQELTGHGGILRDAIVAGAIPDIAQQSAVKAALPARQPVLPVGIMNAPAVLNEIQEKSRVYTPGQAAHVINLSLLPMSPQDLEYLGDALGIGPVAMLSRGYGNCRITSTQLAHVWWVQYFNSMDQIILNTLEVVDVPEVAKAAEEDYVESIERLGEWLAVMKEDTGAALE